jgi:hypothetical protein
LLDTNIPLAASLLYYRLRQVDRDGAVAYSPVRSVHANAWAALSLFPNPTTGPAALAGAGPGTLVRVFDAMGRLVFTTTADSTGAARLVLPTRLLPGVYVVRNGTHALRLVLE